MPASFTVIFIALSSASAFAFIPILGDERGIEGISIFFTFSAAGLLISRVAGLKVPDKFGESLIFYFGAVGYAVSFVVLAFAFSRPVVCAAGFLYGCGSGFAHPILNAMAVRNVNANKRGAATSTFLMFQDIGMAIGSSIWGIVSESYGFFMVYLCSAATALLLVVFFKILLEKSAIPKNM